MIRVPIPLTSMTSLLKGMTSTKRYSDRLDRVGFVTFRPEDTTSNMKQGILEFGYPFVYKQVTTVSKMFMPKQPDFTYKRLVVDLNMWDPFNFRKRSYIPGINEVLQIDWSSQWDTFDVLIHVEKNDTCLYHRKFYNLAEIEVHNLKFV